MNARHSSDNPFAGLIGFVLFIVIVIIVTKIEEKKEKKRKQELEIYCKRNNLLYSEYAINIPTVANSFSLINAHSGSRYAEMSGKVGNYNFSLFDYHYVTGSGKHRQDHNYTICVVSNDKVKIPQFFIRDEDFILDSLGKLFGGQDINFSEDSKFSRKFVLQGKQEYLVRQFFDSKVRKTFVNQHISGYRYEGNLDSFMISAPNKITLNQRISLLTKTMAMFSEIAPVQNNEELS